MKTSEEATTPICGKRHSRHAADKNAFTMTARACAEVVSIGYVYKPSRRQMDSVVAAVKALAPRVPGLSVAQFYEFAAERSLREYLDAPEAFERNLLEYLRRRTRH